MELNKDEDPLTKFTNELISLYTRWQMESDLVKEEMLVATEDALTVINGEVMICFPPDNDLLNWWSENEDL